MTIKIGQERHNFIRRAAGGLAVSSRRLIRNWGVNDAWYATSYLDDDGKRQYCPVFLVWSNIVGRCKSKKAREANFGAYDECTIAEEWKSFTVFKDWADTNGFVPGLQIDKDLLVPGNKEYCPEFCVFVENTLNMLLVKSNLRRGDYPLGVSRHSSGLSYVALLGVGKNKQISLGSFKTPEEAADTYNKAKGQRIRDEAERYIDNGKIYRALLRQAALYESGEAGKLIKKKTA